MARKAPVNIVSSLAGLRSRLSHRAPSIACWPAKKIGIAASGQSRRSRTRLREANPAVPAIAAARKLAGAEKHISLSRGEKKLGHPNWFAQSGHKIRTYG